MDKLDQELREHKHIVFCVDHYNPLDVIRSLGEKGLNPYVILVSEHPVMINHCRYVKKLHLVKNHEEGLTLLLKEYGNESKKPFLYMSNDNTVSCIDEHYIELKNRFITYNAGGEKGRLIWLQNKDNITNLGAQAGLDIPKKEVVDTGVLPTTLKYPVITKVLASTMGAWKGDVHICQNEEELKDAYKKIKSPKLIVQEYVNKVGEFCMEGFSINDGQDIFIPYIADYIRYYGDSYGHYMWMKPFEDGVFKEKIKELFKLTKFNGIFEIEFMKGPDGKNYFLEINLRASTWNYALTVGGGNLPYFWAKSTLAGRILYEEMELRREPFTAIVEPSDFARNWKKVGLIRWICECLGADCHYYFNAKDPMPFFSYVWNRVFKHRIVSEF